MECQRQPPGCSPGGLSPSKSSPGPVSAKCEAAPSLLRSAIGGSSLCGAAASHLRGYAASGQVGEGGCRDAAPTSRHPSSSSSVIPSGRYPVEVFSKSSGVWTPGEAEPMPGDKVRVRYLASGQLCEKVLMRNSEALRMVADDPGLKHDPHSQQLDAEAAEVKPPSVVQSDPRGAGPNVQMHLSAGKGPVDRVGQSECQASPSARSCAVLVAPACGRHQPLRSLTQPSRQTGTAVADRAEVHPGLSARALTPPCRRVGCGVAGQGDAHPHMPVRALTPPGRYAGSVPLGQQARSLTPRPTTHLQNCNSRSAKVLQTNQATADGCPVTSAALTPGGSQIARPPDRGTEPQPQPMPLCAQNRLQKLPQQHQQQQQHQETRQPDRRTKTSGGLASCLLDPDRLSIGGLLGAGGYGAVHRGKYSGEDVAIKRMHGPVDGSITSEQLDSFTKEVVILQALTHPRLVRFIGICLKGSSLCLVTELMPCGSLHDLLHERSVCLDWTKRLSIAVQIAEGVVFLHSQEPPFVHRDIKSMNCVLDDSLGAKLCDFGLAQSMENSHISRRDTEVGSPRYMAPELFQTGGKITEKVDVWALGCLVLEVCTGRIPHEDCSVVVEVMRKTLVTRQWPYIDFRGEAAKVKGIAELCFEFSPAQRTSAARVLEELVLLSLSAA